MVTIDTNRMPFSDAKKRQAVGRLDQRGERLEELDVEDRAVDRRPHREDEPPAGGGQDEADAAVEPADEPADDDADDAGADGDRVAETRAPGRRGRTPIAADDRAGQRCPGCRRGSGSARCSRRRPAASPR